jgi:hypothetical protein
LKRLSFAANFGQDCRFRPHMFADPMHLGKPKFWFKKKLSPCSETSSQILKMMVFSSEILRQGSTLQWRREVRDPCP